MRKASHNEVEVKLPVRDRRALLRQLKRLKVTLVRARVHEMNVLYDTRAGTLARQGQIMRIRIERPAARAASAKSADVRVTLTYKGRPQSRVSARNAGGRRYKVREEHEVGLADATAAATILQGIGLRPWFRYEKYRSTYRLGSGRDLLLELDETPAGDFLELEGARAEIDRCATLLGFAPRDYIVGSYGGLWLERHRGRGRRRSGGRTGRQSEPTPASRLPDMLFRKKT